MASGSGDGPNESAVHPVWRKLPAELVEFVLKRVPFESLVRFRAVCKRFNSLITSPKFARECQRQQVRKPVPVLVPTRFLSTSSTMKVFNTKANNWLTWPLPFIEKHLCLLKVTASSGGLICFNVSLDPRGFVVFNLLTGAFRLVELPTSDEGDICANRAFTSLVVDLQGGTFTLVVVTTSNNELGRKTLLYDSADGSWRSGAPLPDMECFANEIQSFDTVTSNGSIYGLLKSFSYKFSTVLKYDVRSDKWSETSLANVRRVSWNDLEILENRCEVVIVSKDTNEYWRLYTDLHTRHQNFFYRVRETTAGHGETLVVEDRVVVQALHNTEWISIHSHMGYVATVGLGDVICVTKSRDQDRDILTRVMHFNCSNQKFSLLPDDSMESSERPKFLLVEPSLTVDL